MHKVIYAAREQPLFCSLNLLFVGVLVAVAIMFCLRSLLAHQDGIKYLVDDYLVSCECLRL